MYVCKKSVSICEWIFYCFELQTFEIYSLKLVMNVVFTFLNLKLVLVYFIWKDNKLYYFI